MNARTLDAIGTCARTLSGVADTEGVFAQADSATLGPLRAAADRFALRQRFSDPAIDAAHRPASAPAADCYDMLAQARLDALGVTWLAGVARNLLDYPGPANDGLRWLAFEAFSGHAVPREKRDAVERTRAALSREMIDELSDLRAGLADRLQFASAAAAWSGKAAGRMTGGAADAIERAFAIPDRPAGVDVRLGRYALPGFTKNAQPETPSDDGSQTQGARPRAEPLTALAGYRVYTTAFDRIVNAATLATRDELACLRLQLDADFRPLRSTVARMSKRLMRVLMARQTREWRFDLDDGLLDPSRLPAFVASHGAAKPFKAEFESPFPSTVVTLLIDHSGSMRGRPMKIAALTVEIFARVLERCGVKCEVLGFTTRDWDGGEPGRQWAADGYPPDPGRLNALEHIVIKSAVTPWRRARPALGLFLHDDMLKENVDGEALAWAHQRLLARPEKRRILIVVSDGTPMEEATFAANGFDYLDEHLAAVVREIERRSPVKLAAIGIGHDVSQFYRNATRISRIDDLGPALTSKLMSLLSD